MSTKNEYLNIASEKPYGEWWIVYYVTWYQTYQR